MLTNNPSSTRKQLRSRMPASFSLAFLLLAFSGSVAAQVACDNDGIAISFDDNNGAIELRDARVKEITGRKNADQRVRLASPGVQSGTAGSGSYTINSLGTSAFPDNGIGFADVTRRERNGWTARFPRGMYEFSNKNDLILEVEVTVIGGQASHVVSGPTSTVSLSIEDAGIDAKFYGGNPKSLKRLNGDLNFRYSDFLQLTAAGIHSANISLCVNVRGTL